MDNWEYVFQRVLLIMNFNFAAGKAQTFKSDSTEMLYLCIFCIFSNYLSHFRKALTAMVYNLTTTACIHFPHTQETHSHSRLTFFFDLAAHSSSMSAAAHFPCLRYSAPRFFNVVVTVGLKQKVSFITPATTMIQETNLLHAEPRTKDMQWKF